MKLQKHEKVLVIGDVHGCYEEMMELAEKCGIQKMNGRIILLGDVIDRGPKAYEVLQFVRRNGKVESLVGNHELKHLRGEDHMMDPSTGIQKMRLTREEYAGLERILETFPLYKILSFQEKTYLLTHAGCTEAVMRKIEKGEVGPWDHLGKEMSEEIKVITGRASMGREGFSDETKPWYEDACWIPENMKILYGHKAEEEPVITERAIGLDTGAVTGGKLTGILLPEEKIFQVDVRTDYAAKTLENYLDRFYLERYGFLAWREKLELLKKRDLKISGTKERIREEINERKTLLDFIGYAVCLLRNRYPSKTPEEKKRRGMAFHRIIDPGNMSYSYLKKAYFKPIALEELFRLSQRECEDLYNEVKEIIENLKEEKGGEA